jgi:predicted amidohydrolase
MDNSFINGAGNLIPNGGFAHGSVGKTPDGWRVRRPDSALRPVFRLSRHLGEKVLLVGGDGNQDCVARLSTSFTAQAGSTYRFNVRFRMSDGVDPNANLLFIFYTPDYNNGIFRFTRVAGSFVEGENRFFVPGDGEVTAEVWILFRYSARGKVWISEISLDECGAVGTRPARVACTSGFTSMADWAKVIDAAAEEEADLVLLPEDVAGPNDAELVDGPSPALMGAKSAKHKMYVAGGFMLRDVDADRTYNVCTIFGRDGKLVGMYRKNHLYITEVLIGLTPGVEVPVFETDFGKVGIITCYDSFFTDVIELEALKGAEIVLVPAAGIYRSLMPARAADNGVRIVASTWDDSHGIWDTSGCDVSGRSIDPTRVCKCHGDMFSDVMTRTVTGAKSFNCDMRGLHETDRDAEILVATLDLSKSAAPHGSGPMGSGPGGRRNRREQKHLLLDEIKREYLRWWEK